MIQTAQSVIFMMLVKLSNFFRVLRMRCFKVLLALFVAVSSALIGAAASAAVCPFNAVGDGRAADPLRDGLVLIRYAQNLRGTALVEGTGLNDTFCEEDRRYCLAL